MNRLGYVCPVLSEDSLWRASNTDGQKGRDTKNTIMGVWIRSLDDEVKAWIEVENWGWEVKKLRVRKRRESVRVPTSSEAAKRVPWSEPIMRAVDNKSRVSTGSQLHAPPHKTSWMDQADPKIKAKGVAISEGQVSSSPPSNEKFGARERNIAA